MRVAAAADEPVGRVVCLLLLLRLIDAMTLRAGRYEDRVENRVGRAGIGVHVPSVASLWKSACAVVNTRGARKG
jgi:hypothetical protein